MRPSRRKLMAYSLAVITPLAGCSQESASEPSDEHSNLILEYEIGYDHQTNGLDWFSEAFISYNNGQFDQAKADFDSSAEEFSLASDSFQEVSTGLVENGTDAAADVNGDASKAAASAGSDARSCSSASLALPDSDSEEIIERVESDYQQGEYEIPSVTEFENSLTQ